MVKKAEMDHFAHVQEPENTRTALRVTAAEMGAFSNKNKLPEMVYKALQAYQTAHHIKNKYDELTELTQLSETSLKRSVNGRQKITRSFLYKLTVGLHMSVEEADSFFENCGGKLNPKDSPADCICHHALRDGDSIFDFIEEFNFYMQDRKDNPVPPHQRMTLLKRLDE